MKKILKIFVILIAFICATNVSFAQSKNKFGHINSADLLKIMPGRDSVQKVVDAYLATLQTQLKNMQTELETKYNDYLANEKTYSELIKASKQKELQDLNDRISTFQTAAQEDWQNKEQELLAPIINKAKKAIEDVAKENGYTYIFDSSVGVLLYFEPSDDIMNLVKKKLGIK
jgi:outer membrane protein